MQVEKHAMMDRFQTHLAKLGIECVALQPKSIDIDHEFRQNTRGYTGTMNVGTFRVFSRNINYINLLTKVDKGFMHSKMVDVTWKGNGKKYW